MPNNVNKALVRIHRSPPIKPQHPPHPYNALIYTHKRQFFIPTITNKKLTPAQLKHCQELLFSPISMLGPLATLRK